MSQPATRLGYHDDDLAPPRRTVVIRGQADPRLRLVEPSVRPTPRRRPAPVRRRVAASPDRVALWAVLMGLFLVLVAATSAHAA